MSGNDPQPREEQITDLLAACDEALAAGASLAGSADVPAELQGRLERGLACMKLLREVLSPSVTPQHPSLTPDMPPSAPLPSSLGRFQIRRELGHGAFGIVFLAHDPHLRRDVALKVPRAEALVSPEARERFLREARAAAGLEHPNVVPVYEAGEVGAVCYIASAYCPGTTLAHWLKQRDEPVPAREAAALVASLAYGVEHAHGRHVVHRDLKPSNVLLTDEDTPRITDFGLAKLLEGEPGASAAGGQTESGAIVGTPCYMAPEQAGGHSREVGPAADVYALGAILYEVLTGRPPFQGETTLDVLLQVRTEEPVPPGALRAKLPRDLETICLKCLEKSPAKRYATAQALADDLRLFLDGRPIQARPVGRPEKLWRWCRRNPVVALLTAAVAFLLVAGTPTLTILWLQADEQRREADSKRSEAESATAQAKINEEAADKNAKTAKINEEMAKTNARHAYRKAYTSDLRRIETAWEERQVGLVGELLDNQRPARTGGEDLRGFEWYYWHALCRSDLLTLTGDKGPVTCVAFSPDGRLLATGAGEPSWDGPPGEVKLWDPATGQPLLSIPSTALPIVALAFSPDSRRLATAGESGPRQGPGEIKLWDVQTGKLLQTFTGHKKGIQALAYSPDGTLLAGGGRYPGPSPGRDQGELKVWDTGTGREVYSLPGHTGPVGGVAFSPDGTLLASASEKEVKVWDPTTGKEERTLTSKEPCSGVTGLAFSPDGQRLARGARGPWGRVDCWEPRTGNFLFSLQTQPMLAMPVPGIAGVGPIVPRGLPTFGVSGVAFSPDGKRLATAVGSQVNPNQGGEVGLWDLETKKLLLTLQGHTSTVTCVAFSPDGKRLASGSRDQTARVWDAGAEEKPRTLSFADRTRGYLSPGGRLFARVNPDGTVKLWDVETGQEAGTRQVRGPDKGIPPTFSPDGKYLATVDADGVAKVWDVSASTKDRQAGGQEIHTLQLPKEGVLQAAPSPGGNLLAVAGQFPVPLVWDTSTGRQAVRLRARGSAWLRTVSRVIFSPDGKTLAGTWVDGAANPIRYAVKVWDATSGQETHHLELQLPRGQAFWALAFSPDGRYLASEAVDNRVKVWDLHQREETPGRLGKEVHTLKGHFGGVGSLAWSPDGRRLASGAADGLVKVWDAAGEELLSLRQTNWQAVTGVAFSADGRRLISADVGQVKVWSAPPER
jgi:WD40 repeat protein/serine/threonine protein kinase